jgi:hypothetical protein
MRVGKREQPVPDTMLWRWNRAVFKVLGPAQIGDLTVPIPAYDTDPPCSRCGSPESAHVRHQMADGKMLCRCPKWV